MADMMSSHLPQALPSQDYVRILTVHPGSGDEVLHCSVKVLPIDEAECQYEAISYVWGSDEDLTEIIIDGKKLAIHTSLAQALRRFRLLSEPRAVVWADAVSINQNDHVEKNAQVQRMGKIYQKASRVLCWLGRDDQGTAQTCFDLIRDAIRQIDQLWQDGWALDNLIYDLKLPDGFFSDGPRDWRQIKSLLDLPWFERLWVVQESGLARECWAFWGESKIELWEILEFAAWSAYSVFAPSLADGSRLGRVFVDVFIDIMSTYRNQPTWRYKSPIGRLIASFYPLGKQLYVDLLYCARDLKCTDQRETIYASLGSPLAYYDGGEVMVAPDYEEPLPFLQTRAAKALLRNPSEAPQVLLRVSHATTAELDDPVIPTWAPRWTSLADVPPRPIPLTWTYEHRLNAYCASRDSPPFLGKTAPHSNILATTGFVFDKITWTSFLLRADDLRSNASRWDRRFQNTKLSAVETIWREVLVHSNRTADDILSEFSMTLTRGRPGSQDPLDDFLAYCELLRSAAGSDGRSAFPPPESNKGKAAGAEKSVERSLDPRLAYTSEGRLALVPCVAEVGDVCFIMQGVDVPVLLRQVSGEVYQFVGECYVHGVMEGELMNADTPDSLPWGSVNLC